MAPKGMGAKVSKAKRPKRRWIGIAIPSTVETRDDLNKTIEASPLSGCNIRIYDFHNAKSDVAISMCTSHGLTDELGVAILCVLLRDYEVVREYFDSKLNGGIVSLSSSGKIRLVRERLGLPKPSRR